MSTLFSLTYRNLKLNKKRTIVTIIGVVLATALICAVAGMVTSMLASIKYELVREEGNYHTYFQGVDIEDEEGFIKHKNVDLEYSIGDLGMAKLNKVEVLDKPYIDVLTFDKKAIGNYPFILAKGRLPENSKEILISKYFLEFYDYEIGDKLILELGKRVDSEGNELDKFSYKDSYYYDYETDEYYEIDYTKDESIIDAKTYEFEIVGILESSIYDWAYNIPCFVAYTYSDVKTGKLDLYVTYKNAKKYKETASELNPKITNEYGETEDKYDARHNTLLLMLSGVGMGDSALKLIYTMVGVFILIIMVACIFVIRNSFSISIVERYKQFGVLSSVGATSKQIKRSVLYEGFLVGIVAIPLGIGLGCFAVFALSKIVNFIISDFLDYDVLIYSISIYPILVAVVASSVTIYLSCLLPARRASKLSIIEAIRSNNDIKIKSKKLKTPWYVKNIFGIGGEIAYKNLKRSKKKYRTTVVSIVVSIVLFLILNTFMERMRDEAREEILMGDYDIEITYSIYENLELDSDTINSRVEKVSQDLVNLGKYDKYSVFRGKMYYFPEDMVNHEYHDEIMNEIGGLYAVNVIAVGKEEFNSLLKKNGLKPEDVTNGALLIDEFELYNKKKKSNFKIDLLDIKNGDTLKLTGMDTEDLELKVVKRIKEKPMMLTGNTYGVFLIVSDEYFNEITRDNPVRYFTVYIKTSDNSNYKSNFEEYEEKAPDDCEYVDLYDKAEEEKALRAIILIISIFTYGFIAVITLIGVTNIFNTITTNMEFRSREFAMLQAVGMTKKEFNSMIRLESLLYGLKSLFIGITISMILIYWVCDNTELEFIIPFKGIVICIVFVFLIVWMTMKYSVNKINKKNIIETIREENI